MVERTNYLEGCIIQSIPIYNDIRGIFYKVYPAPKTQLGREKYPEVYISVSKAGVFRGLHYHKDDKGYEGSRRVIVLKGEIEDYLLDLRDTKRTYLKYTSLTLKEGMGIFVPRNIAHGFYAKTDCIILYHMLYAFDESKYRKISYKEIPELCNRTDMILSEDDKSAFMLKELL